MIDRTIAEYENIQELTTILKELEIELLSNRSRLKLLEENNKKLELDVNILNENIKQKDKEISKLKKENFNLNLF